MDPKEFLTSNSKIAIYSLFGALILLSILFASAFLVALATVALLVSVIYSSSSSVINPIIARKSNITLSSSGYRLSENLKVAIKNEGDGFKARCISILTCGSRISGQSEKFEEIISKTRFPFEFSVGISEIETKKILESYETKRRMKEIEISRTDPMKSDSISRLNRELEIIETEIKQLGIGVTPTRAIFKLKSTANGSSQSSAANLALSRMHTLSTLFSTTYNLSSRQLSGEELLAMIAD